MKKTDKIYKETEMVDKLSKSMYKAVKKAINNTRNDASKVVADILDPDYEAEVDPDEIPSNRKINVINKNESNGKKTGLDKLKAFLAQRN